MAKKAKKAQNPKVVFINEVHAGGPPLRKLARPYRNILRVVWLVAFLFLFAAGAVFGYLWWTDPEESTTRQALGGATYLLATFALAIALGAAAGWWYLRGIYCWLEAFEK